MEQIQEWIVNKGVGADEILPRPYIHYLSTHEQYQAMVLQESGDPILQGAAGFG